MEKKKSRCMALDCCCYFIPASALLFGFYQQVGCCWGENRFFDRDDAQIIPQYEIWQRLVLSGILWWIFMDAASLPDFIGHILISFLMKPCDVRSVLSGIPLLIRIISFNVSLPVCWEVELIILRGRCVTAHWKI